MQLSEPRFLRDPVDMWLRRRSRIFEESNRSMRHDEIRSDCRRGRVTLYWQRPRRCRGFHCSGASLSYPNHGHLRGPHHHEFALHGGWPSAVGGREL